MDQSQSRIKAELQDNGAKNDDGKSLCLILDNINGDSQKQGSFPLILQSKNAKDAPKTRRKAEISCASAVKRISLLPLSLTTKKPNTTPTTRA